MEAEKLLLVKLTNKAKEKIQESEHKPADISDYLENLDNIRLFRYKYKKSGDEGIALPVNEGEYVLILANDEDNEKHFLAIDYLYNQRTNIEAPDHFELPPNTRCQLIDQYSDVERYHDYAVDRAEICKEVLGLKIWKPYESSCIEERKWGTYLELYKKIINAQKIEFKIVGLKIEKKSLSGRIGETSDEDKIDKIIDAKNEPISWEKNTPNTPVGKEVLKLGRLKRIDNREIKINSNESILKKFKRPSEGSWIELKDEKFQVISSGGKSEEKNQEELLFEYDGIGYAAQGFIPERDKQEQNSDTQSNNIQDVAQETPTGVQVVRKLSRQVVPARRELAPKVAADKTIKIDLTSVVPYSIKCSINFFSEEYQVDVMTRCFGKVKQMPIWKVLSGHRVSKLPQDIEMKFDNSRLNEEQKKAIKGSVGAKELFLIWGPPGTGKTEVIKEVVKQETLKGNKVLITSQTNTAVDNALARLSNDENSYPFRIARDDYKLEGEDSEKVPFQDSSPKFYLDFLERNIRADKKEIEEQQQNIRRQFLQEINKARNAISKENKSGTELREFKQLADLYRKKINVVGSTLMEAGKSTGPKHEPKNKLCQTTGIKKFDTVIIDEVSKATPPELFIPVPLGNKLILVGDHKQLPPMFKMLSGDDKTLEQWAKEVGVDEDDLNPDNTIFERLWDRHTGDPSKCRAMLTKQYRMHPKIEKLIAPFYEDTEGQLSWGYEEEGENEKKKRLAELTIEHDFFKDRPALWIGTRDDSEEVRDGTSFYNEDEIKKTGKLLEKLAKVTDKNMSVGVITFYGAQLRKLKEEYECIYADKFGKGKLVFGTVDRFQGRECDVIICSLVRHNERRDIGFASKPHRINVALSRARKNLIILGHKAQFVYETNNRNEKGQSAQKIYKEIYDRCIHPKPKELEE